MSKKPRIPEAQINSATQFVRSQPIGRYAKDIAKDLNQIFKEHGFRPLASSTIVNLISRIRSHEGQEWTLAKASDIHPEAMPAVLRCWKEAQISGLSFTIREAKWCARLSSFIKDTSALRMWAYTYANRELAYEILDKPFETFETADLDQILTTPPWEMATAYLVGIAKPLETGLYKFDENRPLTKRPIPTTTPPMIISSGVVEIEPSFLHDQAQDAEIEFLYGPNIEESLKAISGERGWAAATMEVRRWAANKQWVGVSKLRKFIKSWALVLPVAPVETIGLSQEAVRVYTLWLGYLAKGPRMVLLENLNPVELRKQVLDRLDIILQLREWVKNHRLASGSEELSTPPWPLIQPLDRIVALFSLKPIDILRKVGCEN